MPPADTYRRVKHAINQLHLSLRRGVCFCLSLVLASAAAIPATTLADETCMSPYMAKIVGQEDYVYVWTLGAEGVGDEQDKLVTVDVNPASPNYGKVVNSLSVGGRNEAHHSGFTDDRHYLWAGGLDTSKIFIFDVHTILPSPRCTKPSMISSKPAAVLLAPTRPMPCRDA